MSCYSHNNGTNLEACQNIIKSIKPQTTLNLDVSLVSSGTKNTELRNNLLEHILFIKCNTKYEC